MSGYMRQVAIITDSSCCLPKELVEQYDIRIVPLILNYRGQGYRDGIDMTPAEVYQIMRLKNELPTTSTASPGAFLEAYRELSQRAENILCITLTGLQSKTYETALVAKEMAREEMRGTTVEVFDSRSVAGALGFIVLEAARAAYRGAGLPEVISVAKDLMNKVNFLAMLDTLYYLERGGRIGRAAAWAGSLLQVKPILEHSSAIGETMPVARPRSKSYAIEYMLKLMAERVKSAKVHVMVHHAGDPVAGEKLKAAIASRFNCAELYLTEFTSIMGVHTGPGLLAIAFYTTREE
jgi:DegV family protein with EDD domain